MKLPSSGSSELVTKASPIRWPKTVSRVVICIGAQKAATSFLFNELANNDQICVSPTKEVHFWDTFEGDEVRRFRRRARRALWHTIRANSRSTIAKQGMARKTISEAFALAKIRHLSQYGLAEYRNYLLRNYKGQPVVFEASPGYALASPDTFSRMATVAQDTRLLLIMRDPVERMWSAAKFIWRQRLESGIATKNDVKQFFLSRIRNPSSLGFRHSAYDLTFKALEKSGFYDRLDVVFQETISSHDETQALNQSLGFAPNLCFRRKVNTHTQHFPIDEDILEEGVKSFTRTYEEVRSRFGARVPKGWHS